MNAPARPVPAGHGGVLTCQHRLAQLDLVRHYRELLGGRLGHHGVAGWHRGRGQILGAGDVRHVQPGRQRVLPERQRVRGHNRQRAVGDIRRRRTPNSRVASNPRVSRRRGTRAQSQQSAPPGQSPRRGKPNVPLQEVWFRSCDATTRSGLREPSTLIPGRGSGAQRRGEAGIDLAALTAEFEREGVRSFCDSYRHLLSCIEQKPAAENTG